MPVQCVRYTNKMNSPAAHEAKLRLLHVKLHLITCWLLVAGNLLAPTVGQQHHLVSSSARLEVASPANGTSSASSPPQEFAPQQTSNVYTNSNSYNASHKLRVNVSNICERNHMRVTVRLNRPFYGLIHTKERRRRPACSLEGTGEQAYTLEISYTLVPTEPGYCGVVAHQLAPASSQTTGSLASRNQSGTNASQQQHTLSVALVVRLHKSIEFSDDRYFLLSCAHRCPRADCSTQISASTDQNQLIQANNNNNNVVRGGPLGRAFVASESIISPLLKAGDHPANKLLNEPLNDWLTSSSPSASSPSQPHSPTPTNTERCDLMLDLKFQWLVKLCWILSVLLLLMFCIAYYLCIALNKANLKRHQRARHLQGNSRRGLFGKNNPKNKSASKQILYPQSQPDPGLASASSWSAGAASAGGANGGGILGGPASGSSVTENDERIEKIRDDNSYLSKQHQQLMLANMLASKSCADLSANCDQDDQQQQTRFVAPTNHQILLGRSGEGDPHNRGHRHHHHHHMDLGRVKRRRSIGSSTLVHLPLELHERSLYSQQNEIGTKLSDQQRAKSKSQTTIHYEQRQDPFEAVPFSYVNSGYLSDGATSQRPYHGSSQGALNSYGQQQQQQHQISEIQQATYPMAQNISSIDRRTQQTSDLLRHDHWPKYKPAFAVPPLPPAPPQLDVFQVGPINGTQQQQQSQSQLTSQFDPKNSRHLIDLIQHKHRQQMAQANRTAATLQELSPSINQPRQNCIPPMHQTRAWR